MSTCPECAQGKHVNCDGRAWDNDTDTITACLCPCPLNPNGAA